MGKLINGINGPFPGKVGTSIGSSWKGIPYIKGPYKKRTGKASKEEKGNRNKFAMAQRWFQPRAGETESWLPAFGGQYPGGKNEQQPVTVLLGSCQNRRRPSQTSGDPVCRPKKKGRYLRVIFSS